MGKPGDAIFHAADVLWIPLEEVARFPRRLKYDIGARCEVIFRAVNIEKPAQVFQFSVRVRDKVVVPQLEQFIFGNHCPDVLYALGEPDIQVNGCVYTRDPRLVFVAYRCNVVVRVSDNVDDFHRDGGHRAQPIEQLRIPSQPKRGAHSLFVTEHLEIAVSSLPVSINAVGIPVPLATKTTKLGAFVEEQLI